MGNFWSNYIGNDTNLNVSYQVTYDSGNAASNFSDYGLTGIGVIGSWLETLALIVIAAIIIGVVINYFAGERTRKRESGY